MSRLSALFEKRKSRKKQLPSFAGLWEEWLDKESGELLETCTIITTEANDVLKPIHDRMPVILKAGDYDEWLDPKESNTDKLQKLLAPYPAKEMDSHAVSRAVNSPTLDSPELIFNSIGVTQLNGKSITYERFW